MIGKAECHFIALHYTPHYTPSHPHFSIIRRTIYPTPLRNQARISTTAMMIYAFCVTAPASRSSPPSSSVGIKSRHVYLPPSIPQGKWAIHEPHPPPAADKPFTPRSRSHAPTPPTPPTNLPPPPPPQNHSSQRLQLTRITRRGDELGFRALEVERRRRGGDGDVLWRGAVGDGRFV